MSFVEKIAGCFGDQDLIFAGHSNDKKRAKEMMINALEEGVSFKDYEKSIKNYLEEKTENRSHINNQMRRVRNLKYYFM
ncbi:hypothetical protein EST62_10610 [Chlorobaculum sp. 24CR]|uniref:hypothetical protein n=1 Tax=Chlorobaculum sp. 24CR TaxID=2508878 RepID=UPI00100AF8E8|nr:hypothetical protein [Chlorobaculum sp. 24CR]RXK82460.1 hypothetical protein EST62_10610 [Chlorobaculum sp. 24CR]